MKELFRTIVVLLSHRATVTTQHYDVAIYIFERDTERETDKERDTDELTLHK